MPEQMTRRTFVQAAAAGAAIAPLIASRRVFGANDRLRVGIVGPGGRGSSLISEFMDVAERYNAEMVAVCDLWKQRREAVAEQLKQKTGREMKVYGSLDDICADGDVDALIIATPDFAHAPHCTKAVKAGKDVYVEKPLGCDFDQLKRCRETVLASDRVVQVGTQRRGSSRPYGCADFVRNGFLGQVSYGEIAEPIFEPRWRIRGSETSLVEQDTNWKEYQDYAYDPDRPFDARIYREFRLFWPFSTGCFCQWMSHQIDIVNLVLGEWPESVVASGGVYVWKDGRTNGDTVQALVTYPSGCLVTYHMRLGNSHNGRGTTLYGTCGTLDLGSGRALPAGGKGRVHFTESETGAPQWHVDPEQLVPADGVKVPDNPNFPDIGIMSDWLDCIRRRDQQTRANIDAGFAHALATTMAGMSYRSGRRVTYDAGRMAVSLA